MVGCLARAYVISSATTAVNGMEVALYKDIHGFGQIFRQTGPVAPRIHWMHSQLPMHKQPDECSFGANDV